MMMTAIDRAEVEKYDQSGMLKRILGFHEQLRHAFDISRSTAIALDTERIRNICVAGMGGSAIGGDIVRSYLHATLDRPFVVSRFYSPPHFVDKNTLFLVSSYSGNTEETLSAYRHACERGAQIVCISAGGELTGLAKKNGHQLVTIPAGAPPRSALGYLTVPLLFCLHYAGLCDSPAAEIEETIALLTDLSQAYAPERADNQAMQISSQLVGKIPLIYCSVERLEAAALRWKGQLNENAKVLAFCNFFPELNHNEVVGWGPNRDISRACQVVYLRDRDDHERVKTRMTVTRQIIEEHSGQVIEVESQGRGLLARVFSLIFLGDMVSLYLAIRNRVDPTAIANIDLIKQWMLKK